MTVMPFRILILYILTFYLQSVNQKVRLFRLVLELLMERIWDVLGKKC